MSLNVTEFGLALTLNTGFNLSAATSLLMEFVRPDGTVFNGTPVAPSTPITSPAIGTFAANEYARYIFQPNDLNQHGEYIVRLVYMDEKPMRLVSEPTSFMVEP